MSFDNTHEFGLVEPATFPMHKDVFWQYTWARFSFSLYVPSSAQHRFTAKKTAPITCKTRITEAYCDSAIKKWYALYVRTSWERGLKVVRMFACTGKGGILMFSMCVLNVKLIHSQNLTLPSSIKDNLMFFWQITSHSETQIARKDHGYEVLQVVWSVK